ncbi:MAG: histidine kinase [Acidobacteriota bacterium]
MSKKRWTIFALVFAGWLLVGLAFGINDYLFSEVHVQFYQQPLSLSSVLMWELVYWPVWASFSPLIFFIARRFPLERAKWLRNFSINIAAGLLITIIHRTVYLSIAWLFYIAPDESLDSLASLFRHLLFFNLPTGFMAYGVILLVAHVINYYKRYQQEEVKASHLKAELAEAKLQITEAELQSLKMQLHPHFLFNTLNSISALLDEDAQAADEMLARLGDFLRLTLENSGAQTVTLQEELEFLRRYLDIEQVRFQDRLQVQFDIEPQTLSAQVPNMILQPMIENAIRHGIAERISGGRIEIRARNQNAKLLLEIKDDGAGLHSNPATSNGQGVGLANTRARLQQIYGALHRFELVNAEEGGTLVTLEIPFIVDAATRLTV